MQLPFNLGQIRALRELDVRGNPALEAAAKLYEGKELQTLCNWLFEFESGSAVQDSIKVVLVGEGIFLLQSNNIKSLSYTSIICNPRNGRENINCEMFGRKSGQKFGSYHTTDQWNRYPLSESISDSGYLLFKLLGFCRTG